ncbi:MAG: hypothetical protein ACR2IJ_00055 [Fluviibacter sp.]
MKYVARTPTIDAVRFKGASSLAEIRALCLPVAMRYSESGVGCELHIQIRNDEDAITLLRGDYFVVERIGDSRCVTVMSEEEFEKKYEPLPEAA